MGFSQVKWVLHDLFLSDKVGFFSEKLIIWSDNGFLSDKVGFSEKPTLSADNAFFFLKKKPGLFERIPHYLYILVDFKQYYNYANCY